jgi:hypothetical protein
MNDDVDMRETDMRETPVEKGEIDNEDGTELTEQEEHTRSRTGAGE